MATLSAEAKSFITEIHPGFVATASKAGRPNVSPKGSFRLLDDEHVVFADVASPQTVANLEENPQVSAIVFDSSTRHGCRIWGRAEILGSGELVDRFNRDMATMKMQARHVIVISVDEFKTF
jgi:uncharacterized protein